MHPYVTTTIRVTPPTGDSARGFRVQVSSADAPYPSLFDASGQLFDGISGEPPAPTTVERVVISVVEPKTLLAAIWRSPRRQACTVVRAAVTVTLGADGSAHAEFSATVQDAGGATSMLTSPVIALADPT